MDFSRAVREYDKDGSVLSLADVQSPNRAGAREAGIDFYVPNSFREVELMNGESTMIEMGVHVRVPEGHALIFFNKSGVSVKKGLKVGACVVDETFQGELKLNLFKDSEAGGESTSISPGEKIIQGLIIPINYSMPRERLLVNLYSEKSQRGEQGWGSDYQEEAMSKVEDVKDFATEKGRVVSEKAGKVFDKAGDIAEDSTAMVKEIAGDAKELASDAAAKAGELAGEAKEKAGKMFNRAKGFFGKKN